eukprot:gb/GEZN01012497.1/.p1 GENE.gb/GEZN01012497.1/~~gb/GEZN01012497.1/.p1  ORF type:complete len:324 (-),score=35.15 gb/GEZN01012497.1/:80-1051(-)
MGEFIKFLWTVFQMALLWLLLPIGLIAYILLKIIVLLRWKSQPLKIPKVIVISGASSGIGEALAVRYAGAGIVLGLTGRNKGRLASVAAQCRKKGATVVEGELDVTDSKSMDDWLLSLDDKYPVDLVIANAGVTVNTANTHDSLGRSVDAVFGTNVRGAFNTILPLVARMKSRKSGQLVFMSSVSGYGPCRGMFDYCSSKACIKVFAEAFRWLLYRDGVHVNVLVPGFITSPMTAANKDHMPFMMDMAPCIEKMVVGLARDVPVIHTHWHFSLLAWILLQVLPDDFRDTIAKTGLSKLVAYHGKRRYLAGRKQQEKESEKKIE